MRLNFNLLGKKYKQFLWWFGESFYKYCLKDCLLWVQEVAGASIL